MTEETKPAAAAAKAEAKAEAKADAKAAKEEAKAEAARADALPQVGDTVLLSDGSSILVHSVMRKSDDGTVLVRAKDSVWRDGADATILAQE